MRKHYRTLKFYFNCRHADNFQERKRASCRPDEAEGVRVGVRVAVTSVAVRVGEVLGVRVAVSEGVRVAVWVAVRVGVAVAHTGCTKQLLLGSFSPSAPA